MSCAPLQDSVPTRPWMYTHTHAGTHAHTHITHKHRHQVLGAKRDAIGTPARERVREHQGYQYHFIGKKFIGDTGLDVVKTDTSPIRPPTIHSLAHILSSFPLCSTLGSSSLTVGWCFMFSKGGISSL